MGYRTDVQTTILGLGGEGVLRTTGYGKEACRVINRALDLSITYCESARAYAGSEEYYGLALRERRKDIFLTSKSHARDKRGAEALSGGFIKTMIPVSSGKGWKIPKDSADLCRA